MTVESFPISDEYKFKICTEISKGQNSALFFDH